MEQRLVVEPKFEFMRNEADVSKYVQIWSHIQWPYPAAAEYDIWCNPNIHIIFVQLQIRAT